jgi:excisionase family DNA binding protein
MPDEARTLQDYLDSGELLSRVEVARLLNVCRKTIQRLVKNKELTRVQVTPYLFRYRPEAVAKFLNANDSAFGPPAPSRIRRPASGQGATK